MHNSSKLCPYHLSKFLTDLLDPVIPTSHCTKDSFTFCEEIKKKVSDTNRFLISYDFRSLLTSISLKETIDVTINLFEHSPGLNNTKTELKKDILNLQYQVHIFVFKVHFKTQ